MCSCISTINQASLHDEFARLLEGRELATLSKDGNVLAETAVLMKAVFILLEMMVDLYLEKTTSKTSRISSLPSSQTDKDESTATPESKPKGSGG